MSDRTLEAFVDKVFDGDGFEARVWNPERGLWMRPTFRLGFIDAPELEQPGGLEAKAFLEGLIHQRWIGIDILFKSDTRGIVDRHGRVVCVPYVRRPGDQEAWDNVELAMLSNGWAWLLERYGPDECYFDALHEAQSDARGIWAYRDNVHPWDFKVAKYRSRRRQSRGRSRICSIR